MKKNLFTLLFTAIFSFSYAQVPVEINAYKKDYTLYAGINYLSNYVYNGRADSLKMNYVIPSFNYENDNGLTLNSEIYILSNGVNNGFDFMEINGEYEFDIYKNLSGALTGTKFFSNGSSESFIGNLNYILGGYVNQKIGALDFVAGVDMLRGSNKTDIRLSPGIESTFEWDIHANHFEITPSFYAIFSTLNYFESYSNTKKSIAKAKRNTALNSTTNSINTIVDNPGLTFMTYEISLPLTFETKNMGISLIPTFAIPKNPITSKEVSTTIVNNKITNSTSIVDTPYSELNLKNQFFTQINFYLKF